LRRGFEALWIKLVELNRAEGKLLFSMGIVKGPGGGESRRWVYLGSGSARENGGEQEVSGLRRVASEEQKRRSE
jgi:hypothetical protein